MSHDVIFHCLSEVSAAVCTWPAMACERGQLVVVFTLLLLAITGLLLYTQLVGLDRSAVLAASTQPEEEDNTLPPGRLEVLLLSRARSHQ